MKTSLISLASLALVAGLAVDGLAQTSAQRGIEAAAAMPNDHGGFDVHAVWSVGMDGQTTVPLDLSTEVILMVNGAQVGSLAHVLATEGLIGDCGSCSGGCGGGYIDGVFNTLLCLDDSQGAFIDCDCKFPSITTTFPDPPIGEGDVIEVLLRPLPGAMPDTVPTEQFSFNFEKVPVGWDRQISDFHVAPSSSAGDHNHEGWIEILSVGSPIYNGIDITPMVLVEVSDPTTGAVQQYQYETPCGPWIKAPGNDCGICDNSLCGKITCNGQTIVEMRCQLDSDGLFCGCTSETAYQLPIGPFVLEPGQDLEIKLVPVPGALPELPGFDEDVVVLEGRWLDVGNALAGTFGDPLLEGAGTLLGGDPVSFLLTNAATNADAFFVIGLSSLYAPFKGGVMVPQVDLIVPLVTDAAGSIGMALPWPNGLPGGFTSYYQYWIRDIAGPVNFSASNGLAATTP